MDHITKWNLLRAVEQAREPLGLRATSLNILRAMVSLIPGDRITPAPDGHLCFASNETLAERAHVSVKTIERHISYLVESGLIRRATQMNGKRWARRDGQGRVVVVSGLSLAPLLQRHAEFTETAKEHAAKLLRLDTIRDRCRILLGQLSHVPELIKRARNILRRRVDESALNQLLNDLTDNLRDSDRHIEGHKEPNSIPEVSQADVENAFPRLTAELRTARNPAECIDRMDDIACELGLGQSWRTARRRGQGASFFLLGYVLQRIDRITHPAAYLATVCAKLDAGETTLADLVGAGS